jgi:hypothetical protein
MTSRNDVEFADNISRRRYLATIGATVAFLGAQLVARPVLGVEGFQLEGFRRYLWAINALGLIALTLPIGGWIFGRRIRSLVNDEISRGHGRMATGAGLWVAILIAIAILLTPLGRRCSAAEASYLIVTPVAVIVPLYFAWLEARAHRDG